MLKDILQPVDMISIPVDMISIRNRSCMVMSLWVDKCLARIKPAKLHISLVTYPHACVPGECARTCPID